MRDASETFAADESPQVVAKAIERRRRAVEGRWCMNRSWPAAIPEHAGHLPMAYDAGLPR